MTALHKSKILITGVQGQVGFELVKALGTLGAQLVLAARRPQDLVHLGYETVELDLSNEAKVREIIQNLKPQLVINPAAYTAVDKAEDDKDSAYAVNERSVAAICTALKATGGALIHFSTDYVYNAGHDKENVETDTANPGNVYAASKLAGEDQIRKSGIPHIVLRTSWVYGANGNNFVKTMLRLGKDRELLKVVSDQIGSPTSAVTLADAVATILVRGSEDPVAYIKAKQGIYNIADSGFTNWWEFAQEIFKQSEKLGVEFKIKTIEAIPTSEYKTPAQRPLNSRLSMAKIQKELGIYTPKWQQSLGLFLHQANLKLN